MCEGGQVWGHARRRGYAAAEIWPKSDFTTAPELRPPFKIDQNAVPSAKNS